MNSDAILIILAAIASSLLIKARKHFISGRFSGLALYCLCRVEAKARTGHDEPHDVEETADPAGTVSRANS